MRGIAKVVIGGLIGAESLIVATALVINLMSHGSGAKSGTEATYSFDRTGFAITYDSKLLKLEIDPQMFGKGYRTVYFVSRLGPQQQGPGGTRSLPTSPDNTRVQVVRSDLMGMTLAKSISRLLAIKPFGPYRSAVRYRRTTLNGMPGGTYDVNLHGTRFLAFVLYAHGYEVDVTAVAVSHSLMAVWPALEAAARSVRPS